MRYLLSVLFLSSAFLSQIHAEDFDYKGYIHQKAEQAENELSKINANPLYESNLRYSTDSELYHYWSGRFTALQDIEMMEHHHRYVQDNDLVWNGLKWVVRQ